MTIAANTPLANLVAAAGQTVFPFGFRIDDTATLQVYLNNQLQPGANYVIALNADQTNNPGGSITFVAPRGAGDVISIERDSPDQQSTVFTTYGPFPATSVAQMADRIVMLVQEAFALLGRMFRVKRSVTAQMSTMDLPAPVAGQALGWVSDGGTLYHLDNIGVGVIGVTPNATLVKNEVPTGNVNSTTGADGNGVFTLAHAPKSGVMLDFYVDGVRQPSNRYVLAGTTVTFNAGYFPTNGSQICADYFW